MGGGADDYFAEHNEIRLDGDARSVAYLSIDESPEAELCIVKLSPTKSAL